MKRSMVMMAVFGVMVSMGSICSASGFLVQTGGRHLPGLAVPAARFTPGPYHPLEYCVHAFDKWFVERLGPRLAALRR